MNLNSHLLRLRPNLVPAHPKALMLVSIIIPTYNRAGTIERAVDSALAQTWSATEIIVVDDGSVDSTLKVLAKYGEKIRVIAQKNQGPSAARNAGIRAAQGDVISFLDSDDSWLPEKTERQAKLLERTAAAGVGCCISNIRMVYADRAETASFTLANMKPKYQEGIWRNATEVLLTRFLLFNQSVAVRRDVLEKAGYFREDLRILEDYDLALRLSTTGPWAYTADSLVIWNGGTANSLTSSATELNAARKSCEILTSLNESPRWAEQLPQKLLRRRVRYLQRCINASQFIGSPNKPRRWYGLGVRRLLKLYKSGYDRMPSFPKMQVEKV